MDFETALNDWAATYMNETDTDKADALTTKWYTSFPTAAFTVLMELASDGAPVNISIDSERVTVNCGEHEEFGSLENIAMVMMTAAYRHGRDEDERS